MTFVVAFLGSLTALLVVAVAVWTYCRHIVIPSLQREAAEFLSGRTAEAMASSMMAAVSDDAAAPPTLRAETAPGATTLGMTTDDTLGVSYQDLAAIMLTMTHTQRVAVLLLLQPGERDEVLNACIRAHNDARNILRNDVTEDIVIDEAS